MPRRTPGSPLRQATKPVGWRPVRLSSGQEETGCDTAAAVVWPDVCAPEALLARVACWDPRGVTCAEARPSGVGGLRRSNRHSHRRAGHVKHLTDRLHRCHSGDVDRGRHHGLEGRRVTVAPMPPAAPRGAILKVAPRGRDQGRTHGVTRCRLRLPVASLSCCNFAAAQVPGSGQSMRRSPPRGSVDRRAGSGCS